MRYATFNEEQAALILGAVRRSGKSQRSVYVESGVSEGDWRRCVTHAHDSLRTASLVRIARTLGVSVSSLFPDEVAA